MSKAACVMSSLSSSSGTVGVGGRGGGNWQIITNRSLKVNFGIIQMKRVIHSKYKTIFSIGLPELGTSSLFPGLLSAHFISMDRYRSSAHLTNFQVRSLLNRSKKNQWFALGKER